MAAAALRRVGGIEDIYIPDPSWGNHQPIFANAGLRVHTYSYLDAASRTGLDFDGMARDLATLPDGCAVLLHACAHNPTGVDPSTEQWGRLALLLARRRILVLFDSAYQVPWTYTPPARSPAIGSLCHLPPPRPPSP